MLNILILKNPLLFININITYQFNLRKKFHF